MKSLIVSLLFLFMVISILGCRSGETDKKSGSQTTAPSDQPKKTAPAKTIKPPAPSGFVAGGTPNYAAAHVTISGTLDVANVVPGGQASLTITAEPTIGWHIYAWASEVSESAIARPTLILLEPTSVFAAGPVTASEPVIEKKDVLNSVSRYHKGAVSWTFPVTVPQGAQAGTYEINGWVAFQICADDNSVCDMPDAARFSVPLDVGGSDIPGPIELAFAQSKYSEAAAATEAKSK